MSAHSILHPADLAPLTEKRRHPPAQKTSQPEKPLVSSASHLLLPLGSVPASLLVPPNPQSLPQVPPQNLHLKKIDYKRKTKANITDTKNTQLCIFFISILYFADITKNSDSMSRNVVVLLLLLVLQMY